MTIKGSFDIHIVTPQGTLLEDSTKAVKLPSVNGLVEILPEHTSYATLLDDGIIEFNSLVSHEHRTVVVAGGVCRFEGNVLTIAADGAEAVMPGGQYQQKPHENPG